MCAKFDFQEEKNVILSKCELNYNLSKCGGGASILMYTHYPKKRKHTYTLIYINSKITFSKPFSAFALKQELLVAM